MENKIDFFEKNLKKIVKKELQLKEQDIEINTVKTRIESIPFLIDTYYQIVVIDGYFQTLRTFWDTNNVEIFAKKSKMNLKLKILMSINFIFVKKMEMKWKWKREIVQVQKFLYINLNLIWSKK